ncbi:DNA alkylation repair enzyme [Corynebacterium kalinowskii]|uniref:DNA alkylation repair enzyme n=1 Tax=Corynebacterium kalinowskii TaxID=2675216 RepID=A0A6B8VHU4_9CORY|nr:DNA alkylation repair protein [Corynebacterium kalinowskii]QGU02579.1 DNA alkylation repair enzyme [Corynebacterium kalinowskii]
MVLTSQLATVLRPAFAELADPERAEAQQRYLKTTEPMVGMVTADLRRLVNVHSLEVLGADPSEAVLLAEVSALWTEAATRDERRAAIFTLTLPRYRKRLTLTAMGLVKQIVREGAWWDLVDSVVKVQEHMFAAYPTEASAMMREWARDKDMWVRRYAIISQLHRKADVDTSLLTECIEPNLADREFFIAKAIGWALRDYAHYNPSWVRAFVDAHELQPLSRREALKHF